jgi:hypothetical protein
MLPPEKNKLNAGGGIQKSVMVLYCNTTFEDCPEERRFFLPFLRKQGQACE